MGGIFSIDRVGRWLDDSPRFPRFCRAAGWRFGTFYVLEMVIYWQIMIGTLKFKYEDKCSAPVTADKDLPRTKRIYIYFETNVHCGDDGG